MKSASLPKDLPSCINKENFESDLAPYKFTVKSPTKPTSGDNNSVSELAKGLVELNLMLQKERECSRSLLQENFILKRQIERMEAGCNCNNKREQSNPRVNKETTASSYSIPVTPIVYESIEIERPVQTNTKRENRRSRRINKQKQNTEPKITQQQDTNQAQNSKMIQVPDSEQAINTPPVVIEDGKHNIPENTANQVATNGSHNDNDSSDSVSNTAPEITHLVRKRLTTEILGDLMVKGIQGFKMKEAVSQKENVLVRSFPAANTDAMNSYVCPNMKKSPSRVILHCGTNDLHTKQSPWTIAEDIIELAKAMESKDTEVLVSSIVQRRDKFNGKALEVNKALERECERMRLGFIDNSNIDPESHLNGSGLHLNMEGTIILANNFIRAMGY